MQPTESTDPLTQHEQNGVDLVNAGGAVAAVLRCLGYCSLVASGIFLIAMLFTANIAGIVAAFLAMINGVLLLVLATYLSQLGVAVASLIDLQIKRQRGQLDKDETKQ